MKRSEQLGRLLGAKEFPAELGAALAGRGAQLLFTVSPPVMQLKN
jgi:hypothetical protein